MSTLAHLHDQRRNQRTDHSHPGLAHDYRLRSSEDMDIAALAARSRLEQKIVGKLLQVVQHVAVDFARLAPDHVAGLGAH
eukprot:3162465-Pleurochrysis_carterae.AAC.1